LSIYQTLLSVAVEHSYNLSGACPCLNFSPTAKTASLLDNAGLLCRQTVDGIQLVYDKTRLEALRLFAQDPEEPLSFDFKVYATDPEFRSYSEPFSTVDDEILYFDNRTAKWADKIILSAADMVSERDFKPAGASELEDLLSTGDLLQPPVFVLRIFAESRQGLLLEQWLEPEPTVYAIRFNSRQRYWKYYLLGRMVKKNGASDGFYIDDPDNKIEFETTGEEILAGRKRAYTFRSKQRIPIIENYQYRFQLKQKGQNGETVVIPSLPFASVEKVGMDTIAEQQAIVSEIYINS
jgi:hypothetical protein